LFFFFITIMIFGAVLLYEELVQWWAVLLFGWTF